MEYNNVSYQNKQYNLNAVLSFDLLKEILFKLLISHDNLEKEIDKIKNSNKYRDKKISKLETIIKDNIDYDEDYSNDNSKLDLTEEEKEDEENINLIDNQNEKTPQKNNIFNEDKIPINIKEETDNINETDKDKNIIKSEPNNYDNANNNINMNSDNTKINNENKQNNNIINNNDNKDDKSENKSNINIDKNTKKDNNKSEESNINKIKSEKRKKKERFNQSQFNVSKENDIFQPSQIPPDLIRNMAKQIKDNKKKIVDTEKKLKGDIKTNNDLLKKDYQKLLKDLHLEILSNIKKMNLKFEELEQTKEDLEKKMEDCISKCSTIDIYNMFKDSGDGTVDAAKVLVRSLEEKVFKKIEFIDTRYKKDASDNLKIKNNVDNLMPNVEKINKDIEKINEYLEKNNEVFNNIIKEADEQKNDIKNINDDKNNILENIDNIKNDIFNNINNKIIEIEKKVDDIKNHSSLETTELFKFGLGKNMDEEAIHSIDKKINDLRKKTNDLENTLKLKGQDMEEMQNEVKNIKLILEKKITRDDLKELYNMHLSDLDEIHDLKDHAGMTFDELRKIKKEITNILQKLDNISGNIVLLQNTRSTGAAPAVVNFDKYVDNQKFTDTLKPILKEIEKMYREIDSLIRNQSEYESNSKNYAKNDRVNRIEDEINTKINDLKVSFIKKYVDKVEFLKNIKQLEIQIKSMDIENRRSDGDSWIMAKKPVGCFNCASCEANIKNVTPSNEYLAWNKYPQQDKIYRMGQGFSHMLQMMTSEFVKSIGNAEKENENDLTSRSNPTLILENQLNSESKERKNSASVLKINNKEQISDDLLKKISNYNLSNSRSKGKVQLPRVLKFKKRLKLKNEGINGNIPISDEECNDSIEREGFKDNTSPKILKILKKKPFAKTEENLNYTQINQTKY